MSPRVLDRVAISMGYDLYKPVHVVILIGTSTRITCGLGCRFPTGEIGSAEEEWLLLPGDRG